MKRQMRNMTYQNLMTVVKRIQAKGYDFETSDRLARGVFEEFAACPQGLSIKERVRRILTKEDFDLAAEAVLLVFNEIPQLCKTAENG